MISFNNINSNSSSSTAAAINSSAKDYHLIYDFSGKRLDSKSENHQEVVKNTEPWTHNKYYKCVSVYLDNEKSIQLIIGESTVQVWRKRKGGLSILEYIWTND